MKMPSCISLEDLTGNSREKLWYLKLYEICKDKGVQASGRSDEVDIGHCNTLTP